MINKELRQEIADMDLAETVIFLKNPALDNSIIGYTDDGRLIYSFEKMVEELAEEEHWSESDAIEFIEQSIMFENCNNGSFAPVIMFDFHTDS